MLHVVVGLTTHTECGIRCETMDVAEPAWFVSARTADWCPVCKETYRKKCFGDYLFIRTERERIVRIGPAPVRGIAPVRDDDDLPF